MTYYSYVLVRTISHYSGMEQMTLRAWPADGGGAGYQYVWLALGPLYCTGHFSVYA